ncbi:DedA family protein [Psychrilyobacter atlanticus]|uniref:DedA family protein n=1 Tax=Psychrilyobacter atlanticus TaxID=271091 RepID=UPI00040E9067|nr:DedA family protein [Psychrilyobacter atlanticus]
MNIVEIDKFIEILQQHQNIAYLILFMGSMVETIIGLSFLFFGEVFFLAGGILAGTGRLDIGKVIVVLYLGGIIGDNISYFIGRKYGLKLYESFSQYRFFNRVINKKNYDKGVSYFTKVGPISVFLARFMGPISWITPFISGVYTMNYRKFFFYNFFGVILGIGQFIVVGYFGGEYIDLYL